MNINRLLGESGYDESIDMTFWTNTFINNRAIDGKAANKTEEYLKVRPNLNKAYPDRNALFLSNRKQRISKRNVQEIIKNELKLSFTDTADKYHTHTLRHTGATGQI